ncbi:transketolase, partial [Chlamydia suis]
NKAHGSPLGEDGVAQTKKFWHLPEEKFFVPSAVKMFFAAKQQEGKRLQEEWQERVRVWSKQFPELHQEYLKLFNQEMSNQEIEDLLNLIDMPESI